MKRGMDIHRLSKRKKSLLLLYLHPSLFCCRPGYSFASVLSVIPPPSLQRHRLDLHLADPRPSFPALNILYASIPPTTGRRIASHDWGVRFLSFPWAPWVALRNAILSFISLRQITAALIMELPLLCGAGTTPGEWCRGRPQ